MDPVDRAAPLLTGLVLMMIADGRVVESEVTRIRWIVGRLVERDVEEHEIVAAVERVRRESMDLEVFIRRNVARFDEEAKRLLLKAAFAVATADGRVVDEEDQMLERLAVSLGIDPQTHRALLTHMMVGREFC